MTSAPGLVVKRGSRDQDELASSNPGTRYYLGRLMIFRKIVSLIKRLKLNAKRGQKGPF